METRHILLGGGATARPRVSPRCRRRLLARQEKQRKKEQEEFGYGKDPDEVTEKQQQACVSASATVGALLRYICRRDLKNKAKNEAEADKYGWGLDEKDLNDQQRQACVSASATVGTLFTVRLQAR